MSKKFFSVPKNYKFGFYVLDPYTNQKQVDIKGISAKNANKIWLDLWRKYK